MTKNLADELGHRGVSATCVHRGAPVTERVAGDAAFAEEVARNALARPITAEEVAGVVAFLAPPWALAANVTVSPWTGGRPGQIWA